MNRETCEPSTCIRENEVTRLPDQKYSMYLLPDLIQAVRHNIGVNVSHEAQAKSAHLEVVTSALGKDVTGCDWPLI